MSAHEELNNLVKLLAEYHNVKPVCGLQFNHDECLQVPCNDSEYCAATHNLMRGLEGLQQRIEALIALEAIS